MTILCFICDLCVTAVQTNTPVVIYSCDHCGKDACRHGFVVLAADSSRWCAHCYDAASPKPPIAVELGEG